MGVIIKEKIKGSGDWWIFIHHKGKRKTKKIGPDKRLAEKIAEQIRAKLILGDFGMDSDEPSLTFRQLADMWLSLPKELRESTLSSYRANLFNHVFPAIGHIKVSDLRRKDLKVFFDSLIRKGKAVSTVSLIAAPVSQIFKYAVELEMIPTNPVSGISFRHVRKEVTPLSESDTVLFLDQARSFLDGKYYPLFNFLIFTGIRIGEAQALTWSDFDFGSDTVNVRRSHRRGVFTLPKSGFVRKADMPRFLSGILRQHKTFQNDSVSFAFPDTSGRRPFNRMTVRNAFERCLSSAGLDRHRLHDLRHTYATIRLLRGHNLGDVSFQMGHSSVRITSDIYAHWKSGSFRNEIEDMANIVNEHIIEHNGTV